ncbi:hypothetical protein N7G274_004456 [Stereocaulon virgatum]|uniref:Uncharacterized protein n=1 Tax=Stereocaulon virgatum TaxID=373712 RepID=A0ABR4A9Y8_9LECA
MMFRNVDDLDNTFNTSAFECFSITNLSRSEKVTITIFRPIIAAHISSPQCNDGPRILQKVTWPLALTTCMACVGTLSRPVWHPESQQMSPTLSAAPMHLHRTPHGSTGSRTATVLQASFRP